MKGFGGGMAQLMKQANQMQMKMKKVQEEMALKEYEGSSGGGAVKIKMTGEHKVTGLTIGPDIFKSGDVEMLQDMIAAAVNEAVTAAKTASQKEMEKITGGMGIPGMF